ncbi:MAG: hypothetical protein EOO57_06790 [Hymenobacter sp.]|nr:MAG: hypothetical protein EOO57_06790 [Hymenobacter sp.]
MKAFTYWLLMGVSGLSACGESCRDVNCAPCRTDVDNVEIYFDLDSAHTGFRAAELRGAYIVRYQRPGFTRARDTVRRQNGNSAASGFGQYQLSLRLNWPKAVQPYTYYAADSIQAHNYRIVLPAAGRQYELSDLDLTIRRNAEDCCNCPYNERRRLRLNNQPLVLDGGGGNTSLVLHR